MTQLCLFSIINTFLEKITLSGPKLQSQMSGALDNVPEPHTHYLTHRKRLITGEIVPFDYDKSKGPPVDESSATVSPPTQHNHSITDGSATVTPNDESVGHNMSIDRSKACTNGEHFAFYNFFDVIFTYSTTP